MKFNLYQTKGDLQPLPEFEPLTDRNTDAVTYLPSEGLTDAVNVALALGQPLLLTGEPGTGKTLLAWHIAQRFKDLKGPHVLEVQTSTSKKDLFYHYDALGHFRWAHSSKGEDAEAEIENRFIRHVGLGLAIKNAKEKGERSVVLIDEIDKAPRDLPNDLLAAIEHLRFDVPEVPGKMVSYDCPPRLRPVIVITSNSEKNLPEAFLRRVVYHHIEFPGTQKLLEILKAKGIAFTKDDDPEAIVKHFEAIRGKGLNKRPATAELIAWASLLPRLRFPTKKLNNTPDIWSDSEKKLLQASYTVLAKTEEDLKKLQ
jgi:MoxR-like ATPase